jgi:polyhydroxyalkanoate synthesis regulator phasin
MTLPEKLTQVFQNEQQVKEATQSVSKLTEINATQVAAVEEQKQQIKTLLTQVESGDLEAEQASETVDQLAQSQLEQLTLQQEAISKISAVLS